MLIIITGTPGCGKTTVSKLLAEKTDAKLISINSLLDEYDLNLGTDELRGYKIVDTERMIPIVDKIKDDNKEDILIFEGHLAQDYPNADIIVVLRCDPLILKERLNSRDWTDKKVDENISAEILGICTQESYETYGEIVQEIDTSSKTPEDVANDISSIISDENEYPVGEIDYLEKYFHLLN